MTKQTDRKQVAAQHYDSTGYSSVERFSSIGIQYALLNVSASELKKTKNIQFPDVLECGVGSGLLRAVIRGTNMSIHYCSCDIDPDLKPDVTGSVTSLPFEERTFDVACCFEVLEHLPIEQLKLALLQLKRVTREYILLSVPDVSPHVAFSIQHILLSQFKVPSLKKIFSNPIYSLFKRKYWMLFCSLPAIFKQKHRFRGEHYWELGKRDFSHQWFAEEIIACELHIIQHFRNWHNPYHHFYVLKVSK